MDSACLDVVKERSLKERCVEKNAELVDDLERKVPPVPRFYRCSLSALQIAQVEG